MKYDDIIIGTGQSGPALAHALAGEGRNVAVIERKDFGGSCVNHGCIPTKAYVASARVAHMARRAGDYGVSTGEIAVDLARVKARKDEMVKQSTGGVEKGLRKSDGIRVITGHAKLVGPREVEVGAETFKADRIVLNVGARAQGGGGRFSHRGFIGRSNKTMASENVVRFDPDRVQNIL